MKVAYTGVSLPEGKQKFQDPVVIALTEQFKPAKVSPYYFEFVPDGYEEADAIVVAAENLLDLLILDIEKVENRIESGEDPAEKQVLEKCLTALESETPLCDVEFSDEEAAIVKTFGYLSSKAVLSFDAASCPDVTELCPLALKKAGFMFFYTAGKQEVHAWLAETGATAQECAGKIHTDLARGFVKADLVTVDDMLTVHSMQDARSKGLVQLVDREFVVPENSVLEIRSGI